MKKRKNIRSVPIDMYAAFLCSSPDLRVRTRVVEGHLPRTAVFPRVYPAWQLASSNCGSIRARSPRDAYLRRGSSPEIARKGNPRRVSRRARDTKNSRRDIDGIRFRSISLLYIIALLTPHLLTRYFFK